MRNGGAAAAVLAAGIGTAVLGLLTMLAAASKGIGAALNFYAPAGPLSGKSTVTVIVWLAVWIVLQLAWRNRQVAPGALTWITLVLVALGLLGTFPPVFETLE